MHSGGIRNGWMPEGGGGEQSVGGLLHGDVNHLLGETGDKKT